MSEIGHGDSRRGMRVCFENAGLDEGEAVRYVVDDFVRSWVAEQVLSSERYLRMHTFWQVDRVGGTGIARH